MWTKLKNPRENKEVLERSLKEEKSCQIAVKQIYTMNQMDLSISLDVATVFS